jgi:DNA-binding XRE family transcriptional regulator
MHSMTSFRPLALQGISLPEQLHIARALPAPEECQRIRETAGVSKERFARTLGVQPATLKRWECRERHPQFRHRVVWSLRIRELQKYLGETGNGVAEPAHPSLSVAS